MGKPAEYEWSPLKDYKQNQAQMSVAPPRCALEALREPANEASQVGLPSSPSSALDIGPLVHSSQDWESVEGLSLQQLNALKQVASRGVLYKHPTLNTSSLLTLHYGGDVEADGNCMFSAFQRAMHVEETPSEIRDRAVNRFLQDYENDSSYRNSIDVVIKNLYSPDLSTGWGVQLVQEVKLLARKEDRETLESAIEELVQVGMLREEASESVFKEQCVSVQDGQSWVKYMSTAGNPTDQYDIITLHYTEDGLLSVDSNADGRAAAFGDDIALGCLATEYGREVFVMQAHGADAMVDDDTHCLFFLPHRPRGQILCPPVFLFMKGTGWCGAGGDHYEPVFALSAASKSDKAVIVL